MITRFLFEGVFGSYNKGGKDSALRTAKSDMRNVAKSAMLDKVKSRVDRVVIASLDESYEVYSKDKCPFDLTTLKNGKITKFPAGWEAEKGLLPVYRLVNEGDKLILVFLCNTREQFIFSNYIAWFGWIRSLKRDLKKALIDNPDFVEGDYDHFPYTNIDVKIELNTACMNENGEYPISFFSFTHTNSIEDVKDVFAHFYGTLPRFYVDELVFFSAFHREGDYQALANYRNVFHVHGSVSIDIQYNNSVTFDSFSFLDGMLDKGVPIYFQISLVRYEDEKSFDNLGKLFRKEYDGRFTNFEEFKALVKQVDGARGFYASRGLIKEMIITKHYGQNDCKLSIEK